MPGTCLGPGDAATDKGDVASALMAGETEKILKKRICQVRESL